MPTDQDDFRVRVELGSANDAARLAHALRALEHQGGGDALAERVAISRDDNHVFAYAATLAGARAARTSIEEALASSGLSGELTEWRWHPLEERWEDAAAALPQSVAERAVERRHLEQAEDAESGRYHNPQWEVRVTFPTRAEARTAAERLAGEGIPAARRWRHLLVGANDEDAALELAERLRDELPPSAQLETEGAAVGSIWNAMHPFAYFGGLGS